MHKQARPTTDNILTLHINMVLSLDYSYTATGQQINSPPPSPTSCTCNDAPTCAFNVTEAATSSLNLTLVVSLGVSTALLLIVNVVCVLAIIVLVLSSRYHSEKRTISGNDSILQDLATK